MKKVLIMLIAMLFTVVGSAMADLNDGLIAYYPFNGNANDESGNGNDGTEFGGITYTEGVIKQAAMFNGTNSYIMLKDTLDNSNGLTFVFWINSEGPTEGENNGVIIGKYNWSNRRNFIVGSVFFSEEDKYSGIWLEYFTNGSVNNWSGCNSTDFDYVRMYPSTLKCESYDDWIIEKDRELELNEWKFVVINIKEEWIEVWVDNELEVKRARRFQAYFNDNENTYIGNLFNAGNGSNNHFQGQLDELRIYKRPLSESEIQELYEGNENCQKATYDSSTGHHIPCVVVDGNDEYEVDMQKEWGSWSGATPK